MELKEKISKANEKPQTTSIEDAELFAESLYQALLVNELIKKGDIELIAEVISGKLNDGQFISFAEA